MADRSKDRPRDEVGERRAHRAADRIAERHKGAGTRVAKYVEERRRAEELHGPVSAAVREAITASGFSLYELARLSGVDDGRLSRFMRGKRSLTLESLDRLAPVLKLRVRFPKGAAKPK